MYGEKTSSRWSDVGNGTIISIIFIVVISIISIVCGGFLIDFYYKNIDNSDYKDLKDDFETLYFYTKLLIGLPITALIFILLWVIFVRSSYIVFAGFFCLLNCFLGALSLSKMFGLNNNNKKK
jgi:ABC-type multidrug transport system permease subunit